MKKRECSFDEFGFPLTLILSPKGRGKSYPLSFVPPLHFMERGIKGVR